MAALLALHGEDRAEGRAAGRTAVEGHAAARGAALRKLRLEILEPALGRAAVEADGGPVAEHLAAFLTQPVCGLAHAPTVARYCPRLFGSTPAKVRKSTMRKSPRVSEGSDGRQLGS